MPNPLQSLSNWLTATDRQPTDAKALNFNLGGMPWTQVQHILVHGPGAGDVDQQYKNDGNSAVFACLMALSAAYIEPPVKVWRLDSNDKKEPLPKHALQRMLNDPHPELTADELWWWTQWARHCDGNAYLRKMRSGNELTGNVVYLHPLSPRLVDPVTAKDSTNFIDAYRYRFEPGKWEDIPPENIIHFRLGIDDGDTRKGMSPLKRLVRAIATDEEATKFSDALLRNFAVPGLVVTTPADSQINREQAEDLSERIADRFGQDGRGRVGVLSAGATISPVGFSPEQMRLDVLHGFPESRICACIGVPPIIANLQIGLEQSANYASMRQITENFTEKKLAPIWRMDDAVLRKHLLPDFDTSETVTIERDLTEVRALQEDMDAKYKRLTEAVVAGWVLPDEARSEIGLPPMEEVAPPPLALPAPTEAPPPEQVAAMRRVLQLKAAGFEDYPALLAAMIELALPAATAQLDAHFDDQRKRIKRGILQA